MTDGDSPVQLLKYSAGGLLILLTVIVGLFGIIEFWSRRVEMSAVVADKAHYQLARCVATVWLIEFLVFIIAIAVDKKFHLFGFSSEAAMGGLYFIIFGPIVFGLTWMIAAYAKYTPSDARTLFVFGSRIGVLSSALPFLMLFFFAIVFGLFSVLTGQEKT